MWLEEVTFKVSWEVEVLGFLELGNSLTLKWGIRKLWALAWAVGTDSTHRVSLFPAGA